MVKAWPSPDGSMLAVASGSNFGTKEGVELYRLENEISCETDLLSHWARVRLIGLRSSSRSLPMGKRCSDSTWGTRSGVGGNLAGPQARLERVMLLRRPDSLVATLSANGGTVAHSSGLNGTEVSVKTLLNKDSSERTIKGIWLKNPSPISPWPVLGDRRGDLHTARSISLGFDLTVWDLGEGKPRLLRTYKSLKMGLGCLTFGPRGNLLAFAGSDRAVRVWDWKDDKAQPVAFAGHTSAIQALSFTPNQDALFRAAATTSSTAGIVVQRGSKNHGTRPSYPQASSQVYPSLQTVFRWRWRGARTTSFTNRESNPTGQSGTSKRTSQRSRSLSRDN